MWSYPTQISLHHTSRTPSVQSNPYSPQNIHTMASRRTLTTLTAHIPSYARLIRPSPPSSQRVLIAPLASSSSSFSTSSFRPAISGPPPSGFRLPRRERWDESNESSLDKAGKYFLLTEMLRGMYVVLEQFFRPPYTIMYPFEKVVWGFVFSDEKRKNWPMVGC